MTSAVRVEPGKVWEQLDDESPAQYSYFVTYIAMEPVDRDVSEVWRRSQRPPAAPGTPAPTDFKTAATRWRWAERALAFDRHNNKKFLERLIARRQTALEQTADLGKMLREKATMAAKLLSTVAHEVGMHEGRSVIVLSSKLTPDQIVKMAEVGVKIEQLALGMPTDRTALMDPISDKESGLSMETAKAVLQRRLEETRARRMEAGATDSSEVL